MNKPVTPPMLPAPDATVTPKAVVRQPGPVSQAGRAPIAPAPSTHHAVAGAPAAYVDPYLFETGYYASPAEYEELSRTAPDRLQLRADVENTRPKRKK